MNSYMAVACLSLLLSAFSQVLLKKSSTETKKHIWSEYVNSKVLAAYGITFFCMLLMVYVLTGVAYKYAAVIESLGYVFIIIFSRLFLKERITVRKALGSLLLIAGVVVFSGILPV